MTYLSMVSVSDLVNSDGWSIIAKNVSVASEYRPTVRVSQAFFFLLSEKKWKSITPRERVKSRQGVFCIWAKLLKQCDGQQCICWSDCPHPLLPTVLEDQWFPCLKWRVLRHQCLLFEWERCHVHPYYNRRHEEVILCLPLHVCRALKDWYLCCQCYIGHSPNVCSPIVCPEFGQTCLRVTKNWEKNSVFFSST